MRILLVNKIYWNVIGTIFWCIIKNCFLFPWIFVPKNCPVAQNTSLGYIVFGLVPNQSSNRVSIHAILNSSSESVLSNEHSAELLSKFCEMESFPVTKKYVFTDDELACEKHIQEIF